jgi:hypothetical protein
MSLQTPANDHTHVIRRRGCIGEVLFTDVSHSLFVSRLHYRLDYRPIDDEGAVSAVLDTNDTYMKGNDKHNNGKP